jgi:lysine-ketoglutarate reductase/saccharopine dehydrogenase-like protein (TIGR00300 family)
VLQPSESVEIRGHLLDSGVLSRVVDDVLDYGGDYRVDRLELGRDHEDESYAALTIGGPDAEQLARILMRIQVHGVNQTDPGTAVTRPAPADGVFPDDFYSTTNLPTQVRVDGAWVSVERPEMDCGLLVTTTGETGQVTAVQVTAVPVTEIRAGDPVVCTADGVRVRIPEPVGADGEPSDEAGGDGSGGFGFMGSSVSSEKPQALLVRQIAARMRAVRASGQRILWVGGPAIVHTGAAPAMVALVEAGYVDVMFAGNALATHDIEASLFGTSLGVDLSKGSGVPHGHEHHIRAINRIRASGSIAAAVKSGVLTGGIMHALVKGGKDFVLVGSVRDDGPLPDVHTDVLEGKRAMRAELHDVGFAIMVATMLHSIATGNLLAAAVPLVCVDINPATVTKLADRGSAQAVGVVTDIGLFLEQLANELVGRR